MTHFAKNLRAVRENKNLSRAKLERELKLGRGRINDYEKSICVPGIDTLIVISDYFCISVDDLLRKNLDSIEYLSGIQFKNDCGTRIENDINQFV